MISDEERREIAEELRARHDCNGFDQCDECQELSLRLFSDTQALCQLEGGCANYWEDLADLIEPEPERTCTMDKSEFADFAPEYEGLHSCSKCGEETAVLACVNEDGDMEQVKPRFCGYCGAKVVNATDGA